MRWQGRRESDNVEDRRNSSGGPSMGGPGFRLPSGKGGLILLIVVLVAGYYGFLGHKSVPDTAFRRSHGA